MRSVLALCVALVVMTAQPTYGQETREVPPRGKYKVSCKFVGEVAGEKSGPTLGWTMDVGKRICTSLGNEIEVPVPGGDVQLEFVGVRLDLTLVERRGDTFLVDFEFEQSELNHALGTNFNGVIVPGRTTQRLRSTQEIVLGKVVKIARPVNTGGAKASYLELKITAE